MIKYFSVSNFSSIKDEIIFEADIGSKNQTDTNKALVVFGANASGKTNLLKSITFLFWFMQKSFFEMKPNQAIPFDPFITQNNQTTDFYVEFIIDENLYKYTLKLTKEKVVYEKLEKNRFQKPIYERNAQEITMSRDISKEKIEKDLSKNISIVSFLSRFETQVFAKEIQQYKVVSNVTYTGFNDKEELINDIALEIIDNNQKQKVLDILRIADTEIVDFELNSIDENEKQKIIESLSKDTNIPPNERDKLLGLISSDKKFLSQLLFKHTFEKDSFSLPYNQESQGTKKLFTKAKDILYILNNGGIYIMDEIDSHLHFKIVEYLVNSFKISSSAQIICSSHSPNIIDECFDAKTLWFTQKENGITTLYSAYDFEEIKKDMSLQKLYEIGRLGAVPKGFYPKDKIDG